VLNDELRRTGLVAILRGVRPDEVAGIGAALFEAGFRIVEVPLNSPDALDSIRILRARLPPACLVGAGTVVSPAQVEDLRRIGGQLIVMPHADPAVIRAAKLARLSVMPGVATPTEAFAALAAGADAGLGSALYAPGVSAKDVAARASAFVDAWQAARAWRDEG